MPPREEVGKMKYSDDESDVSSESESDSDSDSARRKTKRPKLKVKPTRAERENCRMKNDKFKIWNMQVQEESITEDLVSCGVTRSIYKDRNVESYDFTLGYSFNKRGKDVTENNSSDEEKETEPRLTNKRTFNDRCRVKLRLGKRRIDNSTEDVDDDHRGSSRVMSDLGITAESSDADVAADIAAKLSEHKDVLISEFISFNKLSRCLIIYLEQIFPLFPHLAKTYLTIKSFLKEK